jgi:hypothetical protein
MFGGSFMKMDLRTKAKLLMILMAALACIVVVFAILAIPEAIGWYEVFTHKRSVWALNGINLIIYLGAISLSVRAIKYVYPKYKIYQSGISGENRASHELDKLRDSYEVLSNVKLDVDGEKAELDFVVIGSNGVFIVENKNYNGTIEGHVDEDKWVQKKVGQGGTPYSNPIRNPIFQLKREIHILANYLRENGINVFVTGFVYFSNYYANLSITGDSEYIASIQQKDLCDKIRNYRGRNTLDKNQIDRIVRLL